MRGLRAERLADPFWLDEQGDPLIVPYALSLAVKRCGAKDKGEAQRAMATLVKHGRLVFEYALKPRPGTQYGTKCYSLPGGSS